jgi:NADH:ubiquinone oxidoreductase subunit 2 (subunit N)
MYTALLAIGALMILSAGMLAVFERHLGRIFGFAAIQQIGAALLALSLTDEAQTGSLFAGLFFAQLAPQAINLAVWALSLCAVRSRVDDLRFSAVRGLAYQMPVAATSLILANFSAAGLPLLANFPVYVALWPIVAQRSLGISLLALIGNACLFVAALRSMVALVRGSPPEALQLTERGPLTVLLILGAAMLIVVGLMPQWFFPILTNLGLVFTQPAP